MKRIVAVIPHLFTLSNLALGCMAIVFAFRKQYDMAAYSVFLAAGFDFLDGFLARLFKVPSELGKQLDSLADMVTFGVAPGIFMHQMMGCPCPISYTFLFIPVFSAIRLAKFNLDDRQTDKFIGVPTPAIALTITCLLMVQYAPYKLSTQYIEVLVFNKEYIALMCVLLAILLIAPFEMIALKFKGYSIKSNWPKYLLILSGIFLIGMFKYSGGVYLFVLYVLLSLILNFVGSKQSE